MEWLNILSLVFSFIAAIAAIAVPLAIYRKQNKDRRKELMDEYEAMKGVDRFPMSMDEREHFARKSFLEKQLRRR